MKETESPENSTREVLDRGGWPAQGLVAHLEPSARSAVPPVSVARFTTA